MPIQAHHWLRGARRADRAQVRAELDLPPAMLPVVDAHRRLRGPYTATGTLLRAIVPDARNRCPQLVAAHDVEILSTCLELRGSLAASRETLTSLAVPAERTRFYSRLRTLRIAHGITEFLRDYLHALGGDPVSLLVENVEHADTTDQEVFSVLLRRIDPQRLTIVLGTGDGQPHEVLAPALARHAVAVDVDVRVGTAAPAGRSTGSGSGHPADPDDLELAARHVASECTGEEPDERAAYDRLDPVERSRLHDERADALDARDEPSLRLGAIPYHRERGSDPAGAGARALRFALDYSIDMGFYDATVDYGNRGRAVISATEQAEMWWAFTTKMTTSLAALGRAEEAEALYDEARATTASPQVHLQAAYATAMLYTRHLPVERRDHRRAKAWINEAIAIAGLLPDPKERAFNTAFHRNGLALIEVHLGNLPEALRLVTDGLDRLDRELDPSEHRLHRSVLRYNRAQVYAGLRRFDEALVDYTAVIEEDPNYAEYYFDRGNILRWLGRDEEALADYEQAMRLSPPYPEVYYNRGDLRLERGDTAGALADFDYVLELDPNYLDAYVNRAGLLCELGEPEAARRDVDAGLALAPQDPHLLCALGRLEMEAGRGPAANAALSVALRADPGLSTAWATRGVLAFTSGDVPAAIADLGRSLEISDDPAVRFNRAIAYQSCGRWAEAVEDLTAVLSGGVEESEESEVLWRRGRCLLELGQEDRASEDLLRCVALDPDRTAEVVALIPTLEGAVAARTAGQAAT